MDLEVIDSIESIAVARKKLGELNGLCNRSSIDTNLFIHNVRLNIKFKISTTYNFKHTNVRQSFTVTNSSRYIEFIEVFR